jgi:hypothetical protein
VIEDEERTRTISEYAKEETSNRDMSWFEKVKAGVKL